MADGNEYSIALWGPTSSGKTWFVHAFAKKLAVDYMDDVNFSYEIRDAITGNPVPASPPEIDGTRTMYDVPWIFRRLPKIDTEAHRISQFEHLVNVRDDKGASTVGLMDIDNEMSKINIINSDYILLMLDPIQTQAAAQYSKISTSPQDEIETLQDSVTSPLSDNSIGDDKPLSSSEYVDKVVELFNTLVNEGQNRHYHVAVCITKVDQLGVRQRDPWEIIQIFFGRQMYAALKQYQNLAQFTLETFSTSAFGFLGNQANYDVGGLKNKEHWMPYNVEAPLFWLFEKVERGRLLNTASGSIGLKVFGQDRQKMYIPYERKRK